MALRICPQGHQFNKTSDCPVCPICEAKDRPVEGFLATLAAPARRALENNGIDEVEKLACYSEAEILKLHGIGPSSLPKLRAALSQVGLGFRSEE
jgi:DNA-directed RNA polymerase alpha subunit